MKKVIVALCFVFVLLSAEKDYTPFVNDLAKKIKESPFKGAAYERLAYITDTYGPRMWGSIVLEQVIHDLLGQAHQEGF